MLDTGALVLCLATAIATALDEQSFLARQARLISILKVEAARMFTSIQKEHASHEH